MEGDNELAQLVDAHGSLIHAYGKVLDSVRQMKWIQYVARPGITKTFVIQPYVKLYVESHIRSKLLEISQAYLFASQSLAYDSQLKDKGQWFSSKSEDCNKLAHTLESAKSVSGVLKTNIVLILGAIFGIFNFMIEKITIFQPAYKYLVNKLPILQNDPAFVLSIFVLLLGTNLLFIIFLQRPAFLTKRELFIPGYLYDETHVVSEHNVYLLEDRLFSLLGREKIREKDSDRQLVFFGLIGFYLMSLIVAALSLQGIPEAFLMVVALYTGIMALYAFMIIREDNPRVKRRLYR